MTHSFLYPSFIENSMASTISLAERIAQEARASLSSYCSSECKAYCCRKGYLVFTQQEIVSFPQPLMKDLLERGRLKKLDNGSYSLSLPPACPHLTDDLRCTIHSSPLRPKTCGDFPLFLGERTFRLSARCPAVREGKLYPYIAQLLKLGLKIRKGESIADSDFYELAPSLQK